MLIRTCIYCLEIILFVLSVLVLILTLRTKNKKSCEYLIFFSIVIILYFLLISWLIDYLKIPVGIEILVIRLMDVMSTIFNMSSIILCLKKRRNLDNETKSKGLLVCLILLVLLPLPILNAFIGYNKRLIKDSELILIYYSAGNGDFFSNDTYAYAIGKNKCDQFDLAIFADGHDIREHLPYKMREINGLEDIPEYEIKDDSNGITVYKHSKEMCKIRNKAKYSNVKLEKVYAILDE